MKPEENYHGGEGMHVLAIDLGSSGCKALVVEATGRCVGRGESPYPTRYGGDGAAEQNPDDWVVAAFEAGRAAVSAAGVTEVRAVAVVGVTHAAVLLDHTLRPIRPAITMFDTRSTAEVERIAQTFGDAVRDRTQNDVSSLWTWPQLAWLRNVEPATFERIRAILFPKDYVRLHLVREICTDVIDAAGTLFFDPVMERWIEEFVSDAGVEAGWLPEVRRPDEIVGVLEREAAARLGLEPGAEVVNGTTDTAAELLGTGAVAEGDTSLKLASVGRVAKVAREPLPFPGVINYPHVIPGLWYPGTGSKHAASAFAWWSRILWADSDRPSDAFERMAEDAGTVDAGSSGVVFFPHLSGEWAPFWNDDLRGTFHGLSMQHGRNALTRSVLEGVAYAMRRAHDFLPPIVAGGAQYRGHKDGGSADGRWFLIGQGARSRTWGSIMASVFNQQLHVPSVLDAAFGGFVLACLATRIMNPTLEAVSTVNPSAHTYDPDPALVTTYANGFARYVELDIG